MHEKYIDQLPLPQAMWSQILKGLTKHANKEQGKIQHEMARSKNYKGTQNKNDTRKSTVLSLQC